MITKFRWKILFLSRVINC